MFSGTVVPGFYKDIYPAIDPSNFSRKEFEEKVVVVTGSGSGIGKETALAFSRLGAKVVFTDLKPDSAQRAAGEAKQYGSPTLAIAGDVRKLDDMVELVNTVRSTFGEIDIIVFAAGYGMFDKFVISKVEDWWGVIETNLKGPTDLTRLVLPSMIQRNTGKLIYISSRVIIFRCWLTQ
jgi:3-oxoacyl-[acyl-carrier protein] reductase